jgi:hypothetical protein
MAFQAWDFIVGRGFPLFVIGSNEVAHFAILWRREHNGQFIEVYPSYYHNQH